MDLYCPCCCGAIRRLEGGIFIRRGLYARSEVVYTQYAACERCALVSEVDPRTGQLLDLGSIRLADLLVPTTEAVMLFIAHPSSLAGRADS